ncbi:MAG TPA: DUF420 domain-containing protein [Bacteroidia bacterium]|nr:DUF420 domain-containing protein [Bacteroidia bacterium]
MTAFVANDKLYFRTILGISIAIPLVVLVLLYIPGIKTSLDVSFLPRFNAMINSTVSVLLIAGYMAIRKKKITTHRSLMLTAFFLSGLFLISYVTYHLISPDSTKFGDINHDGIATDAEKAAVGSLRYVYYFVLLTHILLSTIIVPLVLFTIYRALSGNFPRHRKLARWTFPLWLYVSVTGVVVYLLIAPYYS